MVVCPLYVTDQLMFLSVSTVNVNEPSGDKTLNGWAQSEMLKINKMKAEIDVSSNDKLRLNDKDNRTAFS